MFAPADRILLNEWDFEWLSIKCECPFQSCIENAIQDIGSKRIVSPNSVLALAAVSFGAALALAAAFRKRRSLATWCFSAGMLTFALESVFGVMWREALLPESVAFWETLTLVTKSLLPGIIPRLARGLLLHEQIHRQRQANDLLWRYGT